MPPQFNRFDEYSIFDDKGEVKRLVNALVQPRDPAVSIDSLRKIDFAYIITLSKGMARKEVELSRSEIDASWGWRNGNIDKTLIKKIEAAIAKF